MRFEFSRNGAPVGAAQWEGPGQVTLHVADPATRRQLAEYYAAETTYLSTGFGQDEEFQIRRRDWTPWEFERASLALAHRMGYEVERTANEDVERRPAPAARANGHSNGHAEPQRMATAAFAAEMRPATNGHRAAEPAPEASA
ncbi:MAG TPA: hypothetical protein VID47_17915 [Actinomycetota bacterium]|jgi:hypothetical protein